MKKTLCISLVLAMLFIMMLGCSSDTPTEQSTTTEVTDSTPPHGNTGAEAQNTPADENAASEEPSILPTAELVVLTAWTVWPPFYATLDPSIQSASDVPIVAELEKRLNIRLDFVTNSTETATEKFNLMTSTGDYTDVFVYDIDSNYSGGASNAVEQEVVADLAGLLKTYAPTFYNYVTEYDLDRELTTGEGYFAGIPTLYSDTRVRETGIVIRGDWLDQLGLSVPETTQEYVDVLTAFKQDLGVTSPLAIANYGTISGIEAAFQPRGWYVENNEVKYGTDIMQEYLSYMHDLYADGLIQIDFMSGDIRVAEGLFLSGNAGSLLLQYSRFETLLSQLEDESAYLTAVPDLVINKGSASSFGEGGTTSTKYDFTNCIYVSTGCSNIEIALAYIDYLFTDEGSLLANYGTEGTTFEYDSNENPQYTEIIANNENGVPASWAIAIYINSNLPDLRLYSRSWYSLSEYEAEAISIWDTQYTGDGVYSLLPDKLAYTPQENEVLSKFEADLNTYYDENYLAFVIGEKDVI